MELAEAEPEQLSKEDCDGVLWQDIQHLEKAFVKELKMLVWLAIRRQHKQSFADRISQLFFQVMRDLYNVVFTGRVATSCRRALSTEAAQNWLRLTTAQITAQGR